MMEYVRAYAKHCIIKKGRGRKDRGVGLLSNERIICESSRQIRALSLKLNG